MLKSSPLDVLPSALLHSSSDVFAPIIAHMANLSFSEGCFPATFKTAKVLSFLKKPGLDKEVMNNYWPIFNLTTISKLLERLVLSRFRRHLTQSPSFSHLQSAYLRGRSTETALQQWRSHGGTGGTRPPTCPKDRFWDSSKSDEKLVNEGWGWGTTL